QKEGQRAVEEALAQALEGSGEPVLTFLFTSDSYDHEEVLREVRARVGDSRIAGFCCGGLIVGGEVLTQAVAVLTLSGEGLRVATSLKGELSRDPRRTGRLVGEELLGSGIDKGTVFVFPDGFSTNVAEAIRGLYEVMGPRFRFVGGGAGDNLKFFRTYQFTEKGVLSDAMAAALLDGLPVGLAIGHGWKPIGDILVITRAQGKRVFEINGENAFTAYSRHLGGISMENFAQFAMRHPLGFPDLSGNFLIRDPLLAHPDGSIEFVSEVPERAVGYIMSCEPQDLIQTAKVVAERALGQVRGPLFVMVFDCISRYLLMGEAFQGELGAIGQVLGAGLPTMGILTFGEVGSFFDAPLFHNKTVLVAVAGKEPQGISEG
ncbi:MAG: hypothetical protein DRG31_06195, partial [Deltaproteobacteria bacterium]